MVHDLYKSFLADTLWVHEEELARYLATDLLELIKKAVAAEEVMENPFVPGNDYDEAEVARTLKVQEVSGPPTPVYTATFTNFGEAHSVTYTFKQEKEEWRITEIASDGSSYRERLAEEPDAEETAE